MPASPMRSLCLAIRRHTTHNRLTIGVVAVIIATIGSLVIYNGYMDSTKRLRVDTRSYAELLDIIAQAESADNYNAYFSDAQNTTIDFTSMSIAEIRDWQTAFVSAGSPSSAVGRYQIIDTTLDSLVRDLAIDQNQLFDPTMQDQLAYALLERRGAERYVNNELTKEEFAAELAKEWAALPRILGDHPGRSYYDGDGLNVSSVEPGAILRAIDPIKPL